MYKQLKAPNLSIIGQPELCLVYVREVFGISPKYPTASTGWNGAQFKHPGEQPPTDVSVPIWFSWKNDGHVAVSVPGKIYSTSAQGNKVFASIQELINFIGGGITYLGWSEDVDGVRVVEPVVQPSSNHLETVAPGTWNVRSQASMNASVIGTVHGGEQLSTAMVPGMWRRISFKGQTGYVGPKAF